MNKTGISWTDLTWNPITGCNKVSEGCKNCYAEAWSKRFGRSFEVQEHYDRLRQIDKVPTGSKVFVNSMSDLFHEKVSEHMKDVIFLAMMSRKDVIFQVLTKRPENMQTYLNKFIEYSLRNIWFGVSIELPKYLYRMDILKETKAYVKFISFEPLLGDIGNIDLTGIDWVIIGGESGLHYRPMNIEWARNIVKQAKEQGIAIWVKQLGGLRPGTDIKDLPEDLRIREFPKVKLINKD